MLVANAHSNTYLNAQFGQSEKPLIVNFFFHYLLVIFGQSSCSFVTKLRPTAFSLIIPKFQNDFFPPRVAWAKIFQ